MFGLEVSWQPEDGDERVSMPHQLEKKKKIRSDPSVVAFVKRREKSDRDQNSLSLSLSLILSLSLSLSLYLSLSHSYSLMLSASWSDFSFSLPFDIVVVFPVCCFFLTRSTDDKIYSLFSPLIQLKR